ncbi:MAG: hypothetical protein AAFY20_05910 [Cyanobacteria bacterium J06639_14]
MPAAKVKRKSIVQGPRILTPQSSERGDRSLWMVSDRNPVLYCLKQKNKRNEYINKGDKKEIKMKMENITIFLVFFEVIRKRRIYFFMVRVLFIEVFGKSAGRYF